MYKVCKYEKEKLVSMFNNRGYEDIGSAIRAMGYWFDVKRSAIDTQFVIINTNEDTIHDVYTEVKVRNSIGALDKIGK